MAYQYVIFDKLFNFSKLGFIIIFKIRAIISLRVVMGIKFKGSKVDMAEEEDIDIYYSLK
jgi:hypothetical protein